MENAESLRDLMVVSQIAARGITDEHVIDAMRKVPRHRFVPDSVAAYAYEDQPLSIGEGQTISQPYIVASMTQAAKVGPGSRVLEIGTGSGYQAAVLAEMGCEVFTIEKVPSLALSAKHTLKECGYENVEVKEGDGTLGWREKSPFDAILVTAGAPHVPEELIAQLAENGRLIIPVGDRSSQQLKCVTKSLSEDVLEYVRFVPLIDQDGW